MYTSGGHLVFQTGATYNISFKTNGGGRVNLNSMDLDSLAKQVSQASGVAFFEYNFVC